MAEDFLKICNNMSVPLDEFKSMFCDRCVQRDCVRSIAGTSIFEKRVTTWEERLFNNIPRMDRQDPRYAQLSAKKFLTIDAGPVPEIIGAPAQSAWIDPRDLDEPSEKPQEIDIQTPPEPIAAKVEVPTTPDPVVQEPADQEPSSPIPPTKAAPAPMNTPNKSRQMLAGAPAEKKVADPWAVPENPETGGVKIVQPGARIRING